MQEDSGSQTFFKTSTLRSLKIFSITHGPIFFSINFHAKSSEEQKKVITFADVQSSAIQMDDYQKLAIFLPSPETASRTPMGRGPHFENH